MTDRNRCSALTVNSPFHALVLAGSRGPDDPIATHAGVPAKAVARVAGTPMILRVLSALQGSRRIDRVTVVGLPEDASSDPEVAPGLALGALHFHPGGASPAQSVGLALTTVPEPGPVLVTTADHALLRTEIVEWFLTAAAETDADAVIGLASYREVLSVSGGTRRTVTRFADVSVCGCNLFALLTPRARNAVGFFRRIEGHRKHPVRIARVLGLATMLKFLFRRLTLEAAMDRLSVLCDARIRAVLVPFGEAAIDVDTPGDLAVVEALLAGEPRGQAAAMGSQSSSST